jgi:hypothetical protein
MIKGSYDDFLFEVVEERTLSIPFNSEAVGGTCIALALGLGETSFLKT